MSKDLHYTILPYITNALRQHSKVDDANLDETGDFYIIEVVRSGSLSSIRVLVSDAYLFTMDEYLKLPLRDVSIDFILVAKPEGHYVDEVHELAKENEIYLGKLGQLMGAINIEKVYNYLTKEEREAKKRKAG